MSGSEHDAPWAALRLVHETKSGAAFITGCEVVVDGEVVARLAASGYTLTADLNSSSGFPRLSVQFPVVAPLGDIATRLPGGRSTTAEG